MARTDLSIFMKKKKEQKKISLTYIKGLHYSKQS